jgi:hypothetical protein
MNIDKIERAALSQVLNGDDPDGDIDRMYIPREFSRVFAELIIKECNEKRD